MAVSLSFSWGPDFGLGAGIEALPISLQKEAFRTEVERVSRFEVGVIERACRCWAAWAEWCKVSSEGEDVPLNPLNAAAAALRLFIARRSDAATGPLATYNALLWLQNHLAAPVDLNAISKPVKGKLRSYRDGF